MPDDNFGERAATTSEVTSWALLVEIARTAARGFRTPTSRGPREDEMRPDFGAGIASSEDGE